VLARFSARLLTINYGGLFSMKDMVDKRRMCFVYIFGGDMERLVNCDSAIAEVFGRIKSPKPNHISIHKTTFQLIYYLIYATSFRNFRLIVCFKSRCIQRQNYPFA
jgi:hypothetical protein